MPDETGVEGVEGATVVTVGVGVEGASVTTGVVEPLSALKPLPIATIWSS